MIEAKYKNNMLRECEQQTLGGFGKFYSFRYLASQIHLEADMVKNKYYDKFYNIHRFLNRYKWDYQTLGFTMLTLLINFLNRANLFYIIKSCLNEVVILTLITLINIDFEYLILFALLQIY